MGAKGKPADQPATPASDASPQAIESIREATEKARQEQKDAEARAEKAKAEAKEAELERERQRTAKAREEAVATVPQAKTKRTKLRDLRTGEASGFDEEKALRSIRETNASFERMGTTPRDLAENRPDFWSAPPAIRQHIEVIFMSDAMIARRPMLTGFPWHIWSPVTKEIVELYGLEFQTTDRKPSGQPIYGMDMSAFWTTREMYDDWKESMKAIFAPFDGHKDIRTAVESRFQDATLIGDESVKSEKAIVDQGQFDNEFGESPYEGDIERWRDEGVDRRFGSLDVTRPEDMMTEEEIRAKRAKERAAAR